MVHYNINISDYKIVTLLSQCFQDKASVHLAKYLPSGTMVTLKRFNMDKIKEESYLVDVNEVSFSFNSFTSYSL